MLQLQWRWHEIDSSKLVQPQYRTLRAQRDSEDGLNSTWPRALLPHEPWTNALKHLWPAIVLLITFVTEARAPPLRYNRSTDASSQFSVAYITYISPKSRTNKIHMVLTIIK